MHSGAKGKMLRGNTHSVRRMPQVTFFYNRNLNKDKGVEDERKSFKYNKKINIYVFNNVVCCITIYFYTM